MGRRIAAAIIPIIGFLILWITGVPGFTPAMKFTVGVVLLTIVWWAFEMMPLPVVSLVPLVAMSLSGILPPSKMLSYYLQPLIFMLIGVFLHGSAALRSGLAMRIAYYLISRRWVQGKTRRIGLSFMIAAAAISSFVSNTATVALFLPIVLPIANAYVASCTGRESTRSTIETRRELTFPAFLVACVLLGAQSSGFAVMVGSPVSLAANSAFEKLMGRPMGIYEWGLIGVPLAVTVFLAYWLVLNRVCPPDREEFPDYAQLTSERNKLGKITGREWVALVGLGLTMLLWLIPPILKQLFGTGAVLAYLDKISYIYVVPLYSSLLYFLIPAGHEGKPLLDWHAAQQDINWGVILLTAGALSFSSLFSDPSIGLSTFLQTLCKGSGSSPVALVLASGVLCLLLTSLISSTGFISMFASLAIPVAASLGINVKAYTIMLAALGNVDFVLPSGGAPAATAFSSGVFTVPRMLRIMLPCALAGAAAILVVSVPLVFAG